VTGVTVSDRRCHRVVGGVCVSRGESTPSLCRENLPVSEWRVGVVYTQLPKFCIRYQSSSFVASFATPLGSHVRARGHPMWFRRQWWAQYPRWAYYQTAQRRQFGGRGVGRRNDEGYQCFDLG